MIGQDFIAKSARQGYPWRVSDDSVEAGVFAFEDVGEFGGPVEGVDFEFFLVVEEGQLLAVEEVGADEGVAAFDVGAEIGEGAFFGEEGEVFLAFEDLEEQGEFGDLDGLRVDIDAEEVVEEDAFALAGCEFVRLRRGQSAFNPFGVGKGRGSDHPPDFIRGYSGWTLRVLWIPAFADTKRGQTLEPI
jgi:hypothetical protein